MSDPNKSLLPHPNIVLKALQISHARLSGRAKVAVSSEVLRLLIEELISTMPFDEAYYLKSNPDVAESFSAGNITSLHEHYITGGYFEGRWGSKPEVDEEFYLRTYPDVAAGVEARRVPSATEHYIITGAAEGRLPAARYRRSFAAWDRLAKEPDLG